MTKIYSFIITQEVLANVTFSVHNNMRLLSKGGYLNKKIKLNVMTSWIDVPLLGKIQQTSQMPTMQAIHAYVVEVI